MKTVMMTGADGKIARILAKMLLQRGFFLILLDPMGSPFFNRTDVSQLECGTEDRELVESVLAGTSIDLLLHMEFTLGNDYMILTEKELERSRETDSWLYSAAMKSGVKEIVLFNTVTVEYFSELSSRDENWQAKIKLASEKAIAKTIRHTDAAFLNFRMDVGANRKHPEAVAKGIMNFIMYESPASFLQSGNDKK